MAAAGRDHEGALGELLAAHVGEVLGVGVELGEQLLDAGDDRLGRQLAGQDADGLGEAADAVDGDALDDGGLAGAGGGNHQFGDAALGGGHRHRQGALDRPDAAVEGQFADDGEVAQLLGQQLAGGDEQAQCDGQVEAASVFTEVGRG